MLRSVNDVLKEVKKLKKSWKSSMIKILNITEGWYYGYVITIGQIEYRGKRYQINIDLNDVALIEK